MIKKYNIVLIAMQTLVLPHEIIAVSKQSQTFLSQIQPQKKQQEKSYILETIQTNSSVLNQEQKTYQSGMSINQDMITSNPNGNGDIGSLLRILPNVQFDNKQLQSTTPGEIDPAKISVSGGLHYQNLFLIDGMGMNNDLNPASVGNWLGEAPGRSQGLAIDTSLLESVVVQDSNVGVAYGGFMGGVIEANTRRPSKKFSAKVSYQITQGNASPNQFSLTKYHIYGDNAAWQDFVNSYSEDKQPYFIKHKFNATMESKINDKFGFLSAFSTLQSFIPIRSSNDDYANPDWSTPIDPTNSATAKQTQKRQIYNAFFKAYYDISDNIRTELTYIYAPQYDYRFLVGTKDDYYNFNSGGHQLGFKTMWDNDYGTLTNTLSYSFLQNSTTTQGYSDTKYWQASDSKHWSNWATWVREGGYAPVHSNQQTLSNIIIQNFNSLDFMNTTHEFQIGAEMSYQYANLGFSRQYDTGIKTATFMTQEQQQQCLESGLFDWCDSTKAYDPREFEKVDGVNVVYDDTLQMNVWKYGQYFNSITRYKTGDIALNSGVMALFIQDNIAIMLGKNAGNLNIRPGLRLDYDTYMGKITPGYRLSINYQAPWNEWKHAKKFATQVIGGINRYYGRSIFAYRLLDGFNALQTTIRRSGPEVTWDSVMQQGRSCAADIREKDPITNEWVYYHIDPITGQKVAGQDYNNCIITNKSDTKFNQLKVPYVDEYVIGFTQSIYDWSLVVKYIYREGKDDIRYVKSDSLGINPDSNPNYTSTYYTFSNDGKSWSNIVTASIQNNHAIEFLGIKSYFLLAFDWTNVKRNYNDYTTLATQGEINDELIRWNGELIYWSQRPADNFVRPYTIRLSTTHTFRFGRIKVLWNNLFRYRAGYFATARSSDVSVTLPDGSTLLVTDYRVMKLPASFTWDMRIGGEIAIRGRNILFVNIDIFNILDTENIALASGNYTTGALSPTFEVGRQFWFELGYKF